MKTIYDMLILNTANVCMDNKKAVQMAGFGAARAAQRLNWIGWEHSEENNRNNEIRSTLNRKRMKSQVLNVCSLSLWKLLL